jgi:hypothetical protein
MLCVVLLMLLTPAFPLHCAVCTAPQPRTLLPPTAILTASTHAVCASARYNMEQLVDQYRDWSLAVGKGTTQVRNGWGTGVATSLVGPVADRHLHGWWLQLAVSKVSCRVVQCLLVRVPCASLSDRYLPQPLPLPHLSPHWQSIL